MKQPYAYDAKAESDRTATINDEASMTIQSAAEETDINTIVRRFGLTQQMPQNPALPRYGDFTEVTDFQSALDRVQQAQEQFNAMPAEMRAYFRNDPQALMEYHEAHGQDEVVALGMRLTGVEKEIVLDKEPAPPGPARTSE